MSVEGAVVSVRLKAEEARVAGSVISVEVRLRAAMTVRSKEDGDGWSQMRNDGVIEGMCIDQRRSREVNSGGVGVKVQRQGIEGRRG